MTENELFETALKTFGWEAQADMLIEEMAELTQALLKFRRKGNHATFDNLCEEFVDVRIVMSQLLVELPVGQLMGWHENKMTRLAELVKLSQLKTKHI